MRRKIVTTDGEITYENDYAPIPKEAPFFKTPHNHDRDQESAQYQLVCEDPSKTQQQFMAEADINNILAKFLNTGQIELKGAPQYGEATEEYDLQNNIVTAYQVEQAWNELPAAVRNILKTPKTFVDYIDHCMQTGDLDPLRELGLAKPLDPEPSVTRGSSQTPPDKTEKAPEPGNRSPEPKTTDTKVSVGPVSNK